MNLPIWKVVFKTESFGNIEINAKNRDEAIDSFWQIKDKELLMQAQVDKRVCMGAYMKHGEKGKMREDSE